MKYGGFLVVAGFLSGCVVLEHSPQTQPEAEVVPPVVSGEADEPHLFQPHDKPEATDPTPSQTKPTNPPVADDPDEPADPEAAETALCTGGPGWSHCPAAIPPPAFHTGVAQKTLLQPDFRPWTSGGRLAVDDDKLFAVDADNGWLVILYRVAGIVEQSVDVGARPEQVVVSPQGAAFVTVRDDAVLARWLPNGALSFVAVGPEPIGLAMSRDGDLVYVATAGDDRIHVVDAQSMEVLSSHPTLNRPLAVSVAGTGHVVVSHKGADVLRFAALNGGGLGSPEAHALRTLVPADGTNGDKTYFKDFHASGARSMAPSPVHEGVFVAHSRSYTGINKKCTSYYGAVNCVTLNSNGRPIINAVSTIGQVSAQLDESGAFDWASPRVTVPVATAHHPDQTLLFVAGMASNWIVVYNTATADPMKSPVATIGVGQAPRGIAFSPDGTAAYVLNSHDFTIGRVSLTPLLAIADTGDQAELPILLTQLDVVEYGIDPLPTNLHWGRRLFNASRDDAVSAYWKFGCASCHFEGEDDGRVWFSADGPRQTIMLAERVVGTGPYGWFGKKNELHGYVTQTVGRMGGSGLSPSALASLAGYIKQLPLPAVQEAWTPSAVNGSLLFDDEWVGCGQCHPGGASDGKVHFVPGEDEPVNTPSLVGLRLSAPYLHDGSAATLYDVLEQTTGWMGHPEALNESEKADLIAYLMML